MVDKTWYDWQRKSPENKYAYGGGTVPALSNFSLFIQYPTGLPPFAHVSSSSHFMRNSRYLINFVLLLSSRLNSPVMVCGTMLPFGMSWTPKEILSATPTSR